jgi:trans-aconitate methyltransferase
MKSRSLIDSQIAYYDARAAEYESSVFYRSGRFGDPNVDSKTLGWLQTIVRTMPFVTSTLELGCGTGIWTRELQRTTRRLHAVDSSSRMLALNRRVCGDSVSYDCVDIFEWEPSQRFDRVVAAFLLSHVPDDRLTDFVERVHRWTSTDGEVLLIDEAVPADDESPGGETVRELADGTRYSIVKISRTLEQIRKLFEGAHFRPTLEVQAGSLLGIVLSSR